MPRIGVLALQGGFAAHARCFSALGTEVAEVRRTAELDQIDGLVMPGGESTTLLRLMRDEPWFEALGALHARGGALFGTCAGAILLARRVLDPPQPSLGLLDVEVRRNAFGRQIDSFETDLAFGDSARPLPAVFIRAPRFAGLGAGVEILARLGGEPVLVRQGRVMAATFHPELTDDRRLQGMFLEMVPERSKDVEDDRRRQPVECDRVLPGRVEEEWRVSC